MTAWQHCGDRLASDKTTAVVQILSLLLVSVSTSMSSTSSSSSINRISSWHHIDCTVTENHRHSPTVQSQNSESSYCDCTVTENHCHHIDWQKKFSPYWLAKKSLKQSQHFDWPIKNLNIITVLISQKNIFTILIAQWQKCPPGFSILSPLLETWWGA